MIEVKRRQITSIPEWLSWRPPYLGGSEIGAAGGYDSFRSALSIYAEKAGMITTERTPAMRRGIHYEEAVVGYFAEDYPNYRIIRPNVYLTCDEYRIACTPDRLLEEKDGPPGIINCQLKTAAKPAFERWDGQPPMSYYLQVATENMLLDAVRGLLVVLVIGTYGDELHVFDVPRHPAAEARIIAIAQEFWKNMDAGNFPPPDFRRDAATIKAMFPRAVKSEPIDLSSDNRLAQILPVRTELKARIKADTEECDALDAEIRMKLGDAESAILPGWRISLREQTRKAHMVAESTSRTLKITATDEDA